MKATNNANRRIKVDGVWFEPGETKKEVDISEDKFSYHFTLEDETTSDSKDEKEDEVEDSKSEQKNNKGDE